MGQGRQDPSAAREMAAAARCASVMVLKANGELVPAFAQRPRADCICKSTNMSKCCVSVCGILIEQLLIEP